MKRPVRRAASFLRPASRIARNGGLEVAGQGVDFAGPHEVPAAPEQGRGPVVVLGLLEPRREGAQKFLALCFGNGRGGGFVFEKGCALGGELHLLLDGALGIAEILAERGNGLLVFSGLHVGSGGTGGLSGFHVCLGGVQVLAFFRRKTARHSRNRRPS